MAYQGTQVASKWVKTNVLLRDGRVSGHVPETRIYSVPQLKSMLSRFGMVVLKPVVGTGGIGLILLEKQGKGYLLKHKSSVMKHNDWNQVLRNIRRICGKRRYLIQRGIHLAEIAGRPIDYRLKMVKQANGWKITALVGRLARKDLFVTNLCRGGTLLTSAAGISRSLSKGAVGSKRASMRRIARISRDLLVQRFPGIAQLGFDFGLDRKGNIWIFEVNTNPH